MREIDVFVSSKMVELRSERDLLWDLIPTLLGGLVTLRPRLYERDAPASNNPTRQVYLDILKKSALYIGLFWNEYGEWTIDEFKQAGDWWIDRLVFVKNFKPDRRDTQLATFLRENSDVLSSPASIYFATDEQLKDGVKRSVEEWAFRRLHKEPERQKRLYHLESFNEPLYRHLREYEAYLIDLLNSGVKNEKRHQQIISEAIITCKAIRDTVDAECKRCLELEAEQDGYLAGSYKYKNNLAYIARRRLTPYCVVGTEGPRQQLEVQRWEWYGSRNKDALHDAVDRLGELIEMMQG